jgi:hypothetical protein
VETIYRNDENQIALGLNYTLNDNLFMKLKRYFAFEVTINGYILEEISREFKNTGIIPNGSSIEKRINKLKIYFKANNNVHLIAIAKDLGLV